MSAAEFSQVLPKNGYTIFDMQEETFRAVEGRLVPGAYSGIGFMGENERLRSVVVEDLKTLQRRGVSCDKIYHTIVAHLERTEQKGDITVTKHLCSNGYQSCPFEKGKPTCHKGRREFVFTNNRLKQSVKISDLGVGLLQHAFFQGKGSYYRVDPELLIDVLELKSGDYKTLTLRTLKNVGNYMNEFAGTLTPYAASKIKVQEYVEAYVNVPFEDPENPDVLDPKNKFCHLLIEKGFTGKILNGSKIGDFRLADGPPHFDIPGHFVFLQTELTMADLD